MLTEDMRTYYYPIKRSTLAREIYGISEKTFKIWIDEIDIPEKCTLSPANLKKIFKHFDLPDDVVIVWGPKK